MTVQNVDKLLAQDQKKDAIKLLYEMIVEAADQCDFVRAQELRLKLIAVDDMALNEIIGSAELIEAAESAVVDYSHYEQWQDLCSDLSEEENNWLFFAFKERSFSPGTALVEQGKHNDNLYFISQGQANIVCQQGANQFLLQQLNAGDIAGEDTFFGISICTTSVVCQTPVKVKYIERNSFDTWQESLPDLEEKIRSYCLSHRSIDHAEAAKKIERRQDKRFLLETSVVVQLQNVHKQDLGVAFSGVLYDVSAGGVCFVIKTSDLSMVRMLLGRSLRLSFSWSSFDVYLRGVIVGSKHRSGDDYTVHVEFTDKNDPLLNDLLAKLKDDNQDQ